MVETGHLDLLRDLADREALQRDVSEIRNEMRDARDAAVTWLHEVFLEQTWPSTVFCRSCRIFDRLLASCPAVRPEQAQLAAVTCAVLAVKRSSTWVTTASDRAAVTRTLLEYTDGAVLLEEVKAWELLVLSKLGWNLETVTACDYLPPLAAAIAPETDQKDAKSLLEDAQLICCLCLRNHDFTTTHPNSLLALSAIDISSSSSSVEASTNPVSQNEDVILKCLRLTPDQLSRCSGDVRCLLRLHLPHSSPSSANSTNSSPTEERGINQAASSPSPLRITSTPKSSRSDHPLREVLASHKSKRAILMDALPENNKENEEENNPINDSGLNSTCPNATKSLSPPSSKSSSKTSSPDSGASSESPKSTTTKDEELDEIDRLLGTTAISPLAKTNR